MSESGLPAPLGRVQRMALAVGLVGLVGCAIGFFVARETFFRSYLVAYLLCLGAALGSMGMGMVSHLILGNWALLVRRFFEAAALTLPLMAVLFLPLLLGFHELYEWAHPEAVVHDPVLQYKSGYLNVPFFIARTALYFVIWIGLALLLVRASDRFDQTGEAADRLRVQRVAAAGLLLYVLSMSFASVDWVMSREPHYYSTIFGFILIVGQALTAMAMATLMLVLLAPRAPFAERVRPQLLNDIGNILLTLVILFAYISFSQFLINWSGHSQEDVKWYAQRGSGGWGAVAMVLVLFHFFVPFFLLLSRFNKRRGRILGTIAGLVLVMRVLDLYWLVAPSGPHAGEHGFHIHWLDFLAPLGLAGIWVAAFLWLLGRRPLLPRAAAQLPEVMGHGDQASGALA